MYADSASIADVHSFQMRIAQFSPHSLLQIALQLQHCVDSEKILLDVAR